MKRVEEFVGKLVEITLDVRYWPKGHPQTVYRGKVTGVDLGGRFILLAEATVGDLSGLTVGLDLLNPNFVSLMVLEDADHVAARLVAEGK